MTGHPADIGGAPVNIVLFQIEDPFRRGIGPDKIAASGVNDSLRLSGGARRIEDVKQVLGVHRFWLAGQRCLR